MNSATPWRRRGCLYRCHQNSDRCTLRRGGISAFSSSRNFRGVETLPLGGGDSAPSPEIPEGGAESPPPPEIFRPRTSGEVPPSICMIVMWGKYVWAGVSAPGRTRMFRPKISGELLPHICELTRPEQIGRPESPPLGPETPPLFRHATLRIEALSLLPSLATHTKP